MSNTNIGNMMRKALVAAGIAVVVIVAVLPALIVISCGNMLIGDFAVGGKGAGLPIPRISLSLVGSTPPWDTEITIMDGETITRALYDPAPAALGATRPVTAKASLRNAPAGFEYLQWSFDPDFRVGQKDYMQFGPEWASGPVRVSEMTIIYENAGPMTATIHVWNCDSAGNRGTGKDSFTVNVTAMGAPAPVLAYPVFTISGTRNSTYKSMSAYSIALTWVNVSAGMTAAELTAKAQDALDTWGLYLRNIDPRPFYDIDGAGVAPDLTGTGAPMNNPYAVFIGGQLDNTSLIYTDPIIINRYWPDSLGVSTIAAWTVTETERKAAFTQAVTEIELMIAALQDSLLYKTGPEEVKAIFQPLLGAMADTISHPASIAQRTGINIDASGAAELIPGISGPLYEYYLGYVPPSTHVYYTSSAGQFPFP